MPAVALSTYRPHLDGLRAVAVYLVVAFHAGADRLAGGFVGVDVFFVLSGYLVTTLLLRDVEGEGGIRFSRFYSRRFRRLLPAAFVTLVITSIVYSAVAGPAATIGVRPAFQASFLYSANWYFIVKSAGYFGGEVANNPVLHFWSLAVEEQFYLVWPLLLAGLVWLARRFTGSRMALVRNVVLVGAAASMAWALAIRTSNPNRAYYGSDTRAYQLLFGAAIALTPGLFRRAAKLPAVARAGAVAGLAALCFLASDLLVVNPIVRGVLVTAVAVGLIVALEAADGGLARRALSLPPMVELGQISYGIYLWHWPVIVITHEIIDPGPLATAAISALVATALASLSFHLLEQPIRRSPLLDGHRTAVIAGGVVVTIISALVLIPAVVDRAVAGPQQATLANTAGLTPVPELDFAGISAEHFGQSHPCLGKAPERCTVVDGSGAHILLIGDSNAQMMIPGFTKMARDHHLKLSLAVTAGCPWQRDLYKADPSIRPKCKARKADAYDRVIPALQPDVIIAMNAPEENGVGFAKTSDAEFARMVESSTRASAKELEGLAPKVVIIESMPKAPRGFEPLTCLEKAEFLEQCRYVVPTDPTRFERFERTLAGGRLQTADLDKLACPFLPICDPVVAGTPVKWDYQHLTERYSTTLAEPLFTWLVNERLVSA